MTTSVNTNRDASGRFRPGHGGRRKGSKNKKKSLSPKELSQSLTDTATGKIEGLLGKALAVIEQQLSQGSLKAATWVLDRILPIERSKLSRAIPDADTTSLEGIVQTAQTACQMAADGRLGLDEASRFITILTNTAQLRGYLQIGELRTMIKEFEKQGVSGNATGTVPLPTWGRLSNRLKS